MPRSSPKSRAAEGSETFAPPPINIEPRAPEVLMPEDKGGPKKEEDPWLLAIDGREKRWFVPEDGTTIELILRRRVMIRRTRIDPKTGEVETEETYEYMVEALGPARVREADKNKAPYFISKGEIYYVTERSGIRDWAHFAPGMSLRAEWHGKVSISGGRTVWRVSTCGMRDQMRYLAARPTMQRLLAATIVPLDPQKIEGQDGQIIDVEPADDAPPF